MNTDPLEQLWHSPANQAAPAAGEKLVAPFLADLRRRRRWHAAWLAWTLLALGSVTVCAAVQLFRRDAAVRLDAWPLAAMLAFPWFIALRFLRRFVAEGGAPAHATQPWSAVLAWAIAHNRAAQRRLAWIAALFVVMLPVSAFAIRHLHATGKATTDQAWSMAAVFAAAFAGGGAFMLWNYFARLRPEQRRLAAQQHDLSAAPSP